MLVLLPSSLIQITIKGSKDNASIMANNVTENMVSHSVGGAGLLCCIKGAELVLEHPLVADTDLLEGN